MICRHWLHVGGPGAPDLREADLNASLAAFIHEAAVAVQIAYPSAHVVAQYDAPDDVPPVALFDAAPATR